MRIIMTDKAKIVKSDTVTVMYYDDGTKKEVHRVISKGIEDLMIGVSDIIENLKEGEVVTYFTTYRNENNTYNIDYDIEKDVK